MRLTLIPPILVLLAACAAPGADVSTEAGATAFLTSGPLACAQDGAAWVSRFAPDGAYGYTYDGEQAAGRWRMAGPGRVCTTDDATPLEQCFTLAAEPGVVTMIRETGERFQCRPA